MARTINYGHIKIAADLATLRRNITSMCDRVAQNSNQIMKLLTNTTPSFQHHLLITKNIEMEKCRVLQNDFDNVVQVYLVPGSQPHVITRRMAEPIPPYIHPTTALDYPWILDNPWTHLQHDIYVHTIDMDYRPSSDKDKTKQTHDKHIQDKDDYATTHTRAARVRRQILLGIGVLIGIGLYAMFSSIFSSAALASLTVGTGTTDHAIEVMQDHEARLTILESRVKSAEHLLRHTYSKIQQQTAQNLMQQLVYERSFMEQQARRIMDALEALFHHRLAPQLVDNQLLANTIHRLDARAHAIGLTMVTNRPEFAFQYDVSHLLFRNGTLHVYLHCPLVPEGSYLELYEFIPVPLPLLNGSVYILPNPEEKFLALSRDETVFRTLTREEIDDCHKIMDVTYCPRSNLMQKNYHPNCLMSLYQTRMEDAAKHCPVMVHPQKDYAVAINASAFMLYQGTSGPVTRRCGKTITTVQLKGTHMVAAPPGCTISSRTFTYEGTITLEESDAINVPQNIIPEQLVTKDALEAIKFQMATEEGMLALMHYPVDVHVHDLQAGFNAEKRHIAYTLTMWAALICAVIIGIVCLVGGCCWKGRQSLTDSRAASGLERAVRYSVRQQSVAIGSGDQSWDDHLPSAPAYQGPLKHRELSRQLDSD